MSARCFIDTNILVYANDRTDQLRHSVSRNLVIELIKAESGVISVQVLSEFWVTVTQKIEHKLSVQHAEKEIALFSLLQIVNLDFPLFRNAVKIQHSNRISYWDSLIVAAAYSAGCGRIYTEDLNHGQKILDMEICNPFK